MDWTMPTHLGEGDLLQSVLPFFSENTLTNIPRNNVKADIWTPCSPVKLMHKHVTIWTKSLSGQGNNMGQIVTLQLINK